MGLRNRLKGFRSVFSRAARRVKAFFGREEDREQMTSTAAFAAIAAQREEADDKRDDGSGSGSGATAPVWRGPDGGDAPECASPQECEDPGEYKNYADEATVRKAREREREQEPDEDLVPDEDEERRNRLSRRKVRQLQEQLERTQHQQRIIANARAAKARQALTEAELEARLKDLQENQDSEGRPDGPEKDGTEPGFR